MIAGQAVAAQFNDVRWNRIPFPMQEKYRTIRAVLEGGDAVKVFLPTLNKRDPSLANEDRNTAYRERAVWYPATSFTLEGFIGLAFRNDPTQTLDGKPGLEELVEDCDGAGVSLYQQSQDTLANVVSVGRHGLYTDWAQEEERPIIKAYNAESIINWRFDYANGVAKLMLVVLEETVEVEDGPWAIQYVKQWREIYVGEDGFVYSRVWRESTGPMQTVKLTTGTQIQAMGVLPVMQRDANGRDVEELAIRSRTKQFTDIPFVFIGSKDNDGNKINEPPLHGLAKLNIGHYRNSADYEDSVFFIGQVQPYITGLDEEWRDHLENPKDEKGNPTGEVIYVGSRKPILLPKDATFGYAQAQENSLVKEAMDSKAEQMVSVGARMIEATPGPKGTATEDENDKEATTSVLSICVANTNEGYQRAIYWCAQYLGMGEKFDAADTYKIAQDFVRAVADAQLADLMVKSWQTGLIDANDVRDYYRKVGLIATERTNQDIEDDVKSKPPLALLGLMAGGAPPKIPGVPSPPKPPQNGNQQPQNGPAARPNGTSANRRRSNQKR